MGGLDCWNRRETRKFSPICKQGAFVGKWGVRKKDRERNLIFFLMRFNRIVFLWVWRWSDLFVACSCREIFFFDFLDLLKKKTRKFGIFIRSLKFVRFFSFFVIINPVCLFMNFMFLFLWRFDILNELILDVKN